MALTDCRECGEQVSKKADACPHCGVKKPGRKDVGPIGMVVVLSLFFVTCFALIGDGETDESPSPPPTRPLSASVQFDGSQFVIHNEDAFAWRNCELVVNGGVFGGGYTLQSDRIEGNTTYRVGAMRFVDGDGMRFNPVSMAPQSFDIHCDAPSGRSHYNGRWGQ